MADLVDEQFLAAASLSAATLYLASSPAQLPRLHQPGIGRSLPHELNIFVFRARQGTLVAFSDSIRR